jgi:hypothetical protein
MPRCRGCHSKLGDLWNGRRCAWMRCEPAVLEGDEDEWLCNLCLCFGRYLMQLLGDE